LGGKDDNNVVASNHGHTRGFFENHRNDPWFKSPRPQFFSAPPTRRHSRPRAAVVAPFFLYARFVARGAFNGRQRRRTENQLLNFKRRFSSILFLYQTTFHDPLGFVFTR
jgi:hypothetical protein